MTYDKCYYSARHWPDFSLQCGWPSLANQMFA
uniref:Uncharacterized protein n=1 Tax=Anguilla anguilla TaxID=7936 RepID=A0A0E9TW24_ANGAN